MNLTQDDVLEKIGNFPLEPMFNKVYITLNMVELDELDFEDNTLSDVQFVMAVGEGAVKTLKPGQKVLIDSEKLMVPVRTESVNAYETVMKIKIDPIEVDGVTYALVDDRVIKAKDNR